MPLEPLAWNVLLLGAWNTAILTPDGVRRRLFQLEDGTPLSIEVPIDRPGPYKIRHDGIIVIPSRQHLDVAPITPTADGVVRAAAIAIRALENLPETPVSAAGVNFRYRAEPIPPALLELLAMPLDDTLAEADYVKRGSATRRILEHGEGVINLEMVSELAGIMDVVINFHKSGTQAALVAWLRQALEFHGRATQLLQTLGLEPPGEAVR